MLPPEEVLDERFKPSNFGHRCRIDWLAMILFPCRWWALIPLTAEFTAIVAAAALVGPDVGVIEFRLSRVQSPQILHGRRRKSDDVSWNRTVLSASARFTPAPSTKQWRSGEPAKFLPGRPRLIVLVAVIRSRFLLFFRVTIVFQLRTFLTAHGIRRCNKADLDIR